MGLWYHQKNRRRSLIKMAHSLVILFYVVEQLFNFGLKTVSILRQHNISAQFKQAPPAYFKLNYYIFKCNENVWLFIQLSSKMIISIFN